MNEAPGQLRWDVQTTPPLQPIPALPDGAFWGRPYRDGEPSCVWQEHQGSDMSGGGKCWNSLCGRMRVMRPEPFDMCDSAGGVPATREECCHSCLARMDTARLFGLPKNVLPVSTTGQFFGSLPLPDPDKIADFVQALDNMVSAMQPAVDAVARFNTFSPPKVVVKTASRSDIPRRERRHPKPAVQSAAAMGGGRKWEKWDKMPGTKRRVRGK